jgi:hypothetical protein
LSPAESKLPVQGDSSKRFAKTIAAVLFGVLVGVLASRPFHVKAAGGHLNVIRVNKGMNVTPSLIQNQVVGFSCVAGGECCIAVE